MCSFQTYPVIFYAIYAYNGLCFTVFMLNIFCLYYTFILSLCILPNFFCLLESFDLVDLFSKLATLQN